MPFFSSLDFVRCLCLPNGIHTYSEAAPPSVFQQWCVVVLCVLEHILERFVDIGVIKFRCRLRILFRKCARFYYWCVVLRVRRFIYAKFVLFKLYTQIHILKLSPIWFLFCSVRQADRQAGKLCHNVLYACVNCLYNHTSELHTHNNI